jgi:Na+-driven multidrug efflux pump
MLRLAVPVIVAELGTAAMAIVGTIMVGAWEPGHRRRRPRLVSFSGSPSPAWVFSSGLVRRSPDGAEISATAITSGPGIYLALFLTAF